ncbi:hypothetical protein CEXT_248991 [Caerostris extrusa]|uniref:LAGLIDADG homing endonuclease n=1 Tax=Caerostris extrusa TaxID=172846 RepID=A0AAV4SFY0_CAEEX|nr:hypothetical protein CEXT_248991 [Caerostris extrusa]
MFTKYMMLQIGPTTESIHNQLSEYLTNCCNSISWSTKKQNCVTMSSSKAEYISAANAADEIQWLIQFTDDLGLSRKRPISLYKDNKSCLMLSQTKCEKYNLIILSYPERPPRKISDKCTIYTKSRNDCGQTDFLTFTIRLPHLQFEKSETCYNLLLD